MANIESNTLLEKLTQINNIKNRLRQTIINIGGGDYISEKSPFAAFPRAISRVHSDINNVSKLLEYIDLGGDLEEIADKENAMYKDTIPYIDNILASKQSLVDNLRVKGVYAEITESLDSLVEKVLKIEGSSPEPEPTPTGDDFYYSTTLSSGDYSLDMIIEGQGAGSIAFRFINTGSEAIDGFFTKTVFTDSGENIINSIGTIESGGEKSISWGFSNEIYFRYKEAIENNQVINQLDPYINCINTGHSVEIKDYSNCSLSITTHYSEFLNAYGFDYLFFVDGEDSVTIDSGFSAYLVNTITHEAMNVLEYNESITIHNNHGWSSWGNSQFIDNYNTLIAMPREYFGGNYLYTTPLELAYIQNGDYDASREETIEISEDLYLYNEYYSVPDILGVYVRSMLYRPSGEEIEDIGYTFKYRYYNRDSEEYEEYPQQYDYININGKLCTVYTNLFGDSAFSTEVYNTMTVTIE